MARVMVAGVMVAGVMVAGVIVAAYSFALVVSQTLCDRE